MRRRRRRLRWLEGLAGNADTLDTRNPFFARAADCYDVGNSLSGHQPLFAVIEPEQVRDVLDYRGTLVRTVGSIVLWNGLRNGEGQGIDAVVTEGLRVVTDYGSSVTNMPKITTTGEGSQDESWIWTRSTFMEASASFVTMGSMVDNRYQIPFGPFVDIHARRRLKADDALAYYINYWSPGLGNGVEDGTSFIAVLPILRCLCALG